ncbi:MAG: hypothetical protein J5714_03110 [Alphaproteobacteria bacterium]|nr:hypothetical protein [Alphaproteobacteria bacterium]
MTKVLVLLSLIITIPAFATDPDPTAQKTVASKAYVDTKQDKIPAGTYGANNSVVTYDSTTGDVQERWILDTYGVVPDYFLVEALKENHLSWLLPSFQDEDEFEEMTLSDMENSIAPVKYVAAALSGKQNLLPAKSSDAHAQAITRGIIDGSGNSLAYITAGGSLGLTTTANAPAVINYVNGTVATSADMSTFTSGTFGSDNATNQDYIKNALVSLELLKDVYSELNTKITNNALPTGTTGTVVTYNGTNATTGVQEFTETAVYDPTNAYDASTDAGKLATMASVKYVCAGWDSETHTDEHCWLWTLPN